MPAKKVESSESEVALFKKKVANLQEMKGSGTELISVYIPAATDRSVVMNQLTAEVSQSSNIKDPKTRKNVQGALRKVINFLKRINFSIPELGLVVFAGNISEVEGRSDIRLFTVRPIRPLDTKLYWCDSHFFMEPLQNMVKPSEVYGLVVLDKQEGTLAILEGKRYEILATFKSRVGGKIRAGGQSAQRFARLREEAEHAFYKKMSEASNKYFIRYLDKLKGVVVGGPGITKDEFLETDLLDYRLKKLVLGKIDTAYTDEGGIREMIDKADDILRGAEIIQEKELMGRFYQEIVKNALAAYGEREVMEALAQGKVAVLLVSEGLEKRAVILECGKCGKREERILEAKQELENRCSDCRALIEEPEEMEYIDFLMEKASHISAETRLVSVDTEEGKQFLQGFGGIGAILRFK